MKKVFVLLVFLITYAQTEAQNNTSITWDEWGVPHITGQTDEELFYAQGWAQMQLHGNLIAELYGRSRGRAAEYWGKEKLQEDILLHKLGLPELAKEWTRKQEPSYKKIHSAFVRGMNDYFKAHPEIVKPENAMIPPFTEEDVNAHAIYVIFTRFVAGDDIGTATRWKELGSNTAAIAPSRSASGKAMLVQNPHLPWFGEWIFTEVHMMKPGTNIYGAGLVGLPGVGIAFNSELGWSHTNNTIDNADTYELELKDGGYLLDGKRKDFKTGKRTLRYKDSTGAMKEETITIHASEHGPVLNMGKTKAMAIRIPGYDRPNLGYQWWKMANAKNFDEFETAIKMMQIPFFNIMYADKAGNIFYMFNGLVPKRSSGDWDYWTKTVKGGKGADIWTSVHSYDDLPKLKNPKSGWLQNTNDPPWSSTVPFEIDRKKFPAYMSPVYMDFRTQSSVEMFADDASITFEELIDYKHSTYLEMADRMLDDLYKAIDEHGTELSREAKAVLEKWDRRSDANSTGAVLFFQWAQSMNPYNQSMYTVKWDENNPRTTPDGLADPKKAVEKLDAVAAELKKKAGTLAIPWGLALRARGNGQDLPGNGADGSVGAYRISWPQQDKDGRFRILGGDSWVGVIEFADKLRARVLLSYGNATQEKHKHNYDQLKLYSEKKLRDAYFYPEDVEKHAVRKETTSNGRF